ncbi:hypothetical protein FACS1894139_07160 [Planctomycetales bacterium]|nr:hypothetical protein FACS1894108_15580 [Planctomycetales bacterium]GHT04659.1 hypothetical protein FACS1894139_07160 [Planctomycetales bacterium]
MPYSSLASPLREKIIAYGQEYAVAEAALKTCEVESPQDGLAVPVLNEFRCAGSHLARSFAAADWQSAEKAVDDAIKHLRRATYDAYDAAISFLQEKCQEFITDYQDIAISPVLPSFIDDCRQLEAVKAEIEAEIRNDSRELYAARKKAQLDKIKAILLNWRCARGELNKIKCDERKYYRRWFMGILVTIVVGVAVPVILAITFR